MTIQEVHDFYWRNWANAMRELGLGVNTYQYWLKNGYIPMPTQLKIEELTNGKLIADINKKKKGAK